MIHYFIFFFSVTLVNGLISHRSYVIPKTLKLTALFDQLGRVTMYKKETCPYCKKAKELLEGHYNLIINYVDIENSDQ